MLITLAYHQFLYEHGHTLGENPNFTGVDGEPPQSSLITRKYSSLRSPDATVVHRKVSPWDLKTKFVQVNHGKWPIEFGDSAIKKWWVFHFAKSSVITRGYILTSHAAECPCLNDVRYTSTCSIATILFTCLVVLLKTPSHFQSNLSEKWK